MLRNTTTPTIPVIATIVEQRLNFGASLRSTRWSASTVGSARAYSTKTQRSFIGPNRRSPLAGVLEQSDVEEHQAYDADRRDDGTRKSCASGYHCPKINRGWTKDLSVGTSHSRPPAGTR